MSKWCYTDNEKIILEYFFTNTDKNVYCAKNTLSSQLRAFLVGQYSRTHVSLRDRFLQLFEDQKKALDKWLLSAEEYVSIDDLADAIVQQSHLKLNFFETKASDFLKKRGVDYGHNSLKDSDTIRIVIEGVSETFTKVVESPFPCLGNFQEKSTRYIHFGEESLIFPAQVTSSRYGDEIVKICQELIQTNQTYSPIVRAALEQNKVLNKEEFANAKAYENTLYAKTFDIVRYLLPCNVATSLWASFSTRTMEVHLTYMLSHPLEEIRIVAQSMHEEALKLSPWLLKHVAESIYEKKRQHKVNRELDVLFAHQSEGHIHQWLASEQKCAIISHANMDDHIVASILFEEWGKTWLSYATILELVQQMDYTKKESIVSAALADRWEHDRMPRALQHTTLLVEFFMDFWAYRDIQRHRATQQLWQGVNAIHGYDYPEYIHLPGMETFKIAYDDIMTKVTMLCRKVMQEDKYVAQYVCALGHLVRTTYEMHPGQIAYIIELRTTPQWHFSYRNVFIELYHRLQKIAPIFSQYIRCGEHAETSRKQQEERSAAKKQALDIG